MKTMNKISSCPKIKKKKENKQSLKFLDGYTN